MKKFFLCKLCLIATVLFPIGSAADAPVLGACKRSEMSTTSVEISRGIQFSHNGFWHQVADDAEPFTHAIAKTESEEEFLADFRDCRQGVTSKECYYGWTSDLPRQRGLKVKLTMFRSKKTCSDTYSQDDVDTYLQKKKEEADRQAKLDELKKRAEQRVKTFNDECIFGVMPESPNALVSESVRQLCVYLSKRYAEQGLLSVKFFVTKGDGYSARLVCNINDSWGRKDPTFLKSVASRCDRFAEVGDQLFISKYSLAEIKNLTSVLDSPLLKLAND